MGEVPEGPAPSPVQREGPLHQGHERVRRPDPVRGGGRAGGGVPVLLGLLRGVSLQPVGAVELERGGSEGAHKGGVRGGGVGVDAGDAGAEVAEPERGGGED